MAVLSILSAFRQHNRVLAEEVYWETWGLLQWESVGSVAAGYLIFIWALSLYLLTYFEKTEMYIRMMYHFSTLRWHLSSWYLTLWKTKAYLSFFINIMTVDVLATQGARASAAMVLSCISWDITASALDGSMFLENPVMDVPWYTIKDSI